jgi:hypothetical protein
MGAHRQEVRLVTEAMLKAKEAILSGNRQEAFKYAREASRTNVRIIVDGKTLRCEFKGSSDIPPFTSAYLEIPDVVVKILSSGKKRILKDRSGGQLSAG